MMAQQPKNRFCSVYISPDERRLLAKVASQRGVGRDYLALNTATESPHAKGRPFPRWLGRQDTPPRPPAPPKPRASPQKRHCRSCAHLSLLPGAGDVQRVVCGAGVWQQTMRAQSLQTSLRLRLLSLTCPRYTAIARPTPPAPRHCRACRELAEANTADERYVCARSVWTNPMKPQSVANARRLARVSATCPFYAPRAGRWIPRSKSRR